MFDYILQYPHEVLSKIFEHIELTVLAVSLAVIIGVPLGIISSTKERFGRLAINIINIIQTVPSLAFFGLLLPLPFIGGIGAKPAITVLFLYALLPIVKSTYIGLKSVEKSVIEAARGIGMTPSQRLWMVKFPIAFPAIMSGIRMSSVLTIGTVTIAAIIGAGGLGDFIYRGTSTLDYGLITAGTLPAILLALATDKSLEMIEKRLNIGKFMRKISSRSSKTAICMSILSLTLIGASLSYAYYKESVSAEVPVRIGVKNLTENRIIAQMVKECLQKRLKKPVVIANLHSTPLLFQALANRDIDLCVEYTGTVYSAILKQTQKLPPVETLRYIQQRLSDDYKIHVFEPLGFENSFAFALREEDGQKYGIRTLSQLKEISPTLTIGTTSECHDREDGLKGLKKCYGLEFKSEKIVEMGIRYKAIAQKEVDIIDAFTTDGYILSQNLFILEDDLHFFPPYFGIVMASDEFLQKYPQAAETLNALQNTIDDRSMQMMNYQVDVEKKSVEQVVQAMLEKKEIQASHV